MRRITQHRLQLADRLRQDEKLLRQLAWTHELLVLQQHTEQRLRPLAGRLRHLEQPQCVSGRRHVDHDHIVVGARVEHRDDAEQLVDAGRRQVHQLCRPVGAVAQVVRAECGRDLIQRRLEVAAPRRQRARRVELAHQQILRTVSHGGRCITHRRGQHVGKGVRRIGRQQKHPPPWRRTRDAQRRRSGHRRLPDAAFTTEENQRGAVNRGERFWRNCLR